MWRVQEGKIRVTGRASEIHLGGITLDQSRAILRRNKLVNISVGQSKARLRERRAVRPSMDINFGRRGRPLDKYSTTQLRFDFLWRVKEEVAVVV